MHRIYTSFISQAINIHAHIASSNIYQTKLGKFFLFQFWFWFCYYSLFIYLFIFWLFLFNTVYNLFADHTIVHWLVQTNTVIYRSRSHSHAFKGNDLNFIFVINVFYQREHNISTATATKYMGAESVLPNWMREEM